MQRHEAPHTHCVAWQIAQTWHAAEWCRLVDGRDGIELSGSVAGAIDGTPFRVDYAIACDADWLTRSARVTRWIGAAARQIDLRCDGGRWTIDGVDAPALDGRDRRRSRLQSVDEHAADPSPRVEGRRCRRDPDGMAALSRIRHRARRAALHADRAERVPLRERHVCGRPHGRRSGPRDRLRRMATHRRDTRAVMQRTQRPLSARTRR